MFGFNLFSFEIQEKSWYVNLFTIAWGDGWIASLFYMMSDEDCFAFDIFGLATLIEYISEKIEKD